MKVISNFGRNKIKSKKLILAIGVFDGLHLGHQKLLKTAARRAKQLKCQLAVMTFYPHPVQVLRPRQARPLIVSLAHRLKLMEKFGVDIVLVVNFTKSFSKLSGEDFIRRFILGKLNAGEIFVGNDFRFGHQRKHSLENFAGYGKSMGVRVNIIKLLRTGSHKIGSSKIREMIAAGDLAGAKKLLGRDISIWGKVEKGFSRGRKLGFPTANITPKNLVLPPNGVYAVKINFANKIYQGMASIGLRPTFKIKNPRVNIEVFIFNFRRNIYGREIEVRFLKKIRDEKKFLSPEQLITQIKKDQKRIKNFFV